MDDLISEYLKTNIAFWLSIINGVIVTFNFFYKLYKERVSLSVNVVGNRPYRDSKNTALEITIINNSMSPVSIDSIDVEVKDNSGNKTTGKVIGRYELFYRNNTRSGQKVTIDNEVYFRDMPFQLSPKGSDRGWHRVRFDYIALTDLSHYKCELIIYCNSKKKKFTIKIPASERVSG